MWVLLYICTPNRGDSIVVSGLLVIVGKYMLETAVADLAGVALAERVSKMTIATRSVTVKSRI